MLVSPGVYRESVTVGTDGIVLRGVDRNRTILDGEFKRANGVFVVGADGVAVENLTARNFTENGFFWSGVLGYRGSYLTAYRNGDYGVYAYDSQYGQFDHSYASGSPDSGFYIGQCNPCHAVITDVVSEYNQLGYSGSNSSGDLYLVNSVWSRNRTGIVPNSFDGEELSPQGQATIAGNVVDDNGDAARRAHRRRRPSTPPSAVGIVIAGGIGNIDHEEPRRATTPRSGSCWRRASGSRSCRTSRPANQVTDNVVEGSGLADLASVLPTPTDGNCFSGNTFSTSAPANIEQVMPCDGAGTGDLATGAVDIGEVPRHVEEPRGSALQEDAGPGEAAHDAARGNRQGATGGRAGRGRSRRDHGADRPLGQDRRLRPRLRNRTGRRGA